MEIFNNTKNNPQHLVYAVRQMLGYDGWDYDKAKDVALKHIENINLFNCAV